MRIFAMVDIPRQQALWQPEVDHWLEVQNTALNDIELAKSRVTFAKHMLDNLLSEVAVIL